MIVVVASSSQGEVRISEDRLSSFISTAKSLGIRGLTRHDGVGGHASSQAKDDAVGSRAGGGGKRRRSESLDGESADEDFRSVAWNCLFL